jgi:hypothetical protein
MNKVSFKGEGMTEGLSSFPGGRENLGARMLRFHAEADRGLHRIGQKPWQAMEWLIKFMQQDESLMSEGDIRNLQYELVAIENCGLPVDAPWLADHRVFELNLCDSLPTVEEIMQLRSWIRSLVGQILETQHGMDTQTLPIDLPSVPFRLFYNDDDDSPQWTLVEAMRERCKPNFRLLLLITQHAHQIRRCHECQVIFLADRRNKEYCTPKCQSRVAARRYRKEHGLITGRKPGRPRKEEQAPTKTTATKKGTRTTKGGPHGKKG